MTVWNEGDWVALREEGGRIHLVELSAASKKVKGLGVFNSFDLLSDVQEGEMTTIGHKHLRLLKPRLPELRAAMVRRAQLITPKDAGFLIAWCGIGPSDHVLEAGLGSGGLAQHLFRVLGSEGQLISVEPRQEHSEVAMLNIKRAEKCLPDTPTHHIINGFVEERVDDISSITTQLDTVILDLPEPWVAMKGLIPLLKVGGRLACYCPVTTQLEIVWEACEQEGFEVEWAGELMERRWGRASKGGMRPVNGPMGHTAFLLVAVKA